MITEQWALEFIVGEIEREIDESRSQHGEMTLDPVRQGWILTREFAEFIRETDLMMREPMDEMTGPNHRNNPYWATRRAELIQMAAVSVNILIRILQIEEAANVKPTA